LISLAGRVLRIFRTERRFVPYRDLLPLADNEGRRFAESEFEEIHNTLVDRFGGLTAFSRAPARGLFESEGKTSRDDILIIEVMADTLDRSWWAEFRDAVEAQFRQQEIMLRASEVTKL
jgi:hypothetical protein